MERLTKNKRRMIEVLYRAAPEALYGLEISRLANIPSGSLYPALRSLRKAGIIHAEWRTPDDDPDGQPLRFYELTPNGFALAKGLNEGKVEGSAWRQFLPAAPGWELR
ncbi:MAG: helix-turn-helix transcriptional regulator [Actinomycetota bacterium]